MPAFPELTGFTASRMNRHALGGAAIPAMVTEREYCPRHPDWAVRTRFLVNDDGRIEEEYVEVTPCPLCEPKETPQDRGAVRGAG